MKDYKKARELAEKTTRIEPNRAEAQELLGNACYALKDSKCAIEAWEKACELDPSKTQLKKNAKELKRRTGG